MTPGSPYYGYLQKIEISFTRPANTDAYTAGDVIGTVTAAENVHEILAARDVNKGFYCVKARLVKSSTGVTNPNFKVLLFSDTVTGAADNAAFAPTLAQLQTLEGEIDLTAEALGANGAIALKQDIRIACLPESGTQNIYVVLVADGAYAPASGEQFELELYFDGN